MRHMSQGVMIFFIIFLGCSQKSNSNKKNVLINAIVVDLETGKLLKDKAIYISDGIIDSIGDSKENIKGYEVYDVKNQFVIPGLIDSHVHATAGPPQMMLEVLHNALKGGVTTVRDMGGDGIVLKEWSEGKSKESIPNIYFSAVMAGRSWLQTDRRAIGSAHGTKPGTTAWLRQIEDESDIEKAVIEAKNFGVTGIKIYADIKPNLLQILARKAKEQGLKVWGHATIYPAGPQEAIDAGIEVISHAQILLYHLNEKIPAKYSLANLDQQRYTDAALTSDKMKKLLSSIKENNTVIDATLFVSQLMTKQKGGNQKELTKLTYKLIQLALKQKIKIIAGTDALMSRGEVLPNIHEELRLLVEKGGLTNLDALRAATILPAEVLGIENLYGKIKKDFAADIIVLEKNPLLDISNTKSIHTVFKSGVIIE